MNNKLVKVLGATCGALLLVILGEWFYAKLGQQQLLNTQLPIDKKALPDEMPGINLTEHDEGSYADLVNRPLFIEGRKPVNEPPPDTVKSTDVEVKFDWLLNGVYTSKKGPSALLTHTTPLKTRKENYRRITVGTLLDGWTLAEIKKDRVIFTQDGEQKELLLRKPKPKQLPPKPGNPTPPEPGEQPEGAPPPAPEEEPEDLMQEPESPEDLIENTENE
ncbi:MAG: hypothetical protein CTY16_03420 [Methylobacter sp.]|uniref:hypothetical protein n=1 Tax=Methylovulum miyakonense TaxID=645578 RepID=UPI000D4B7674|nr:MAG: hypothetical protein CTY16_03420 [Methylobacter sp.]